MKTILRLGFVIVLFCIIALPVQAQSSENIYFQKSQTELYYDDNYIESLYGIEDGISHLYVDYNAGIARISYLDKHRIAVQFECPFDTCRLLNTQIYLKWKKEVDRYCKFELQILDENWNTIQKTIVGSQDPGLLLADFSDENILVGKIFAVAIHSDNLNNIYIGIDSTSSVHSYVIFENEKPTKIGEPAPIDYFNKYNEGKYNFIIRAVVKGIEVDSLELETIKSWEKKDKHGVEIAQCIEILGGGENITTQEIKTVMEKLDWYGELALEKLLIVFENRDKEDANNIARRMNTITVLGDIGCNKAINPLRKLVDGNALSDEERRHAEESLRRLEEQRVIYQRAAYSLNDIVIYAFSARLIDYEKKSINYLSNALKAYNWEVRLDALAALLEIEEKMNVAPIIQLLKDDHEDIRLNAAAVLAVYKDKRALHPLIKTLQDDSWAVRKNVIKALEAIGDPSAIDHIEKLKKDPNDFVRDSANKAIRILEKKK